MSERASAQMSAAVGASSAEPANESAVQANVRKAPLLYASVHESLDSLCAGRVVTPRGSVDAGFEARRFRRKQRDAGAHFVRRIERILERVTRLEKDRFTMVENSQEYRLKH